MRVAVVGAGAFGGWTAYHLLRSGADVTLIDAWGPGHSRSSSGGETRIIRTVYGDDSLSVRLSARSLQLWKEYEIRWNTRLFFRTGALFLGYPSDSFLEASRHVLNEQGIVVQQLSPVEASARYPQINFDGVGSVLVEPDAGYLTARQNCRTLVKRFIEEGGRFELSSVQLEDVIVDLPSLRLSNGSTIQADNFVFACGPWLPKLFPHTLGAIIRPTRQDVVFLSTPPGDERFSAVCMPCWADRTSEGKFYGVPDVEHRGFKIASDLRGDAFDPTTGDRTLNPSVYRQVLEFVRYRFPALAQSEVTESRVCQYENTPDLGLLVDRHPLASNVLLVGGGSGHGYKQAPAIGEYAAGLILGTAKTEPALCLDRFRHQVSNASHCSF